MASVTMKELLEAGVHFGHQTRRWNPKMKRYIYGGRNGIYIIDLHQTLKLFDEAQKFIQDLAESNRTLLFVGTNDAQLHAFDTGAYDATPGIYGNGTGLEAFSFIPRLTLPIVRR